MSHAARIKGVAQSARDILYGMDAMYRFANRGVAIGGWSVLEFQPGQATLEKTTPHHCAVEQGILTEALSLVGCPVNIEQSQCMRKGAESCLFVLTSSVVDARWLGRADNAFVK
jgi:hypothetical protein